MVNLLINTDFALTSDDLSKMPYDEVKALYLWLLTNLDPVKAHFFMRMTDHAVAEDNEEEEAVSIPRVGFSSVPDSLQPSV